MTFPAETVIHVYSWQFEYMCIPTSRTWSMCLLLQGLGEWNVLFSEKTGPAVIKHTPKSPLLCHLRLVKAPRRVLSPWWGKWNIHFSALYNRKVKGTQCFRNFSISNDLFTMKFTAQMGRGKIQWGAFTSRRWSMLLTLGNMKRSLSRLDTVQISFISWQFDSASVSKTRKYRDVL